MRSAVAPAILMGLAAAATLALAWPRFRAAMDFLPVDAAIEAYYLERSIPANIDRLVERANRAAETQPHPRYWSGLSLLHRLAALDASQPLARQREAFEQATAAGEQSLNLAPLQPREWLSRAVGEGWLSFRGEPVIDAWKTSIYLGRFEPSLLLNRVQLGYARLGQMDEEGQRLLRDQTLLAWRIREWEFTQALRAGDIDLSRVRLVLGAAHESLVQAMEEALGPAAR